MSLKTKELRTALADFLKAAWNCRCTDPPTDFARFRLHQGHVFEVSEEAQQKQAAFAKIAIKKLGPVKGHARSIDAALWDVVVNIEDADDLANSDFLNKSLNDIENNAFRNFELIKPCVIIKIPDNLDKVNISNDISICRTDRILDSLNDKHESIRFSIHNEWEISRPIFDGSGKINSRLPEVIWLIRLVAADPLKGEQSLWLVDVVLSVLRFSVGGDGLGPFGQRLGFVECHPFESYSTNENCITLTDRGASLNGASIRGFYEITDRAIEEITEKANQEKITDVMQPSAGTLAERFHQGCGWLTRARRSSDRSDRILYIFTALESLLSDSDKSAPVIQTIARNASSLCSSGLYKRIEISKIITDLYSVRSALVHSGKRHANQEDVNEIESIAEYAFQVVWDKIDLKMKHQDFIILMKKAGFGFPLESILP